MIEAIIFDWIGTLYQFGGKGLFPYSERVLTKLRERGYKLAVISKALPEDIEARKKQIDEIRSYVDYILVDTEKTREQFLNCIKILRTIPSKTLVVDDRSIRGIHIGNQIGCETAWIQNGKYSHEIPNDKTGFPKYLIDSVEDLLKTF